MSKNSKIPNLVKMLLECISYSLKKNKDLMWKPKAYEKLELYFTVIGQIAYEILEINSHDHEFRILWLII